MQLVPLRARSGPPHEPWEPCPLADLGGGFGTLSSCCAFEARVPALYLTFFDRVRVAARLYEDKSADEATAFATELRRVAAELRDELRMDVLDQQLLAGVPVEIAVAGVAWQVHPGEAFSAIEIAAKWHEKVGELGFSVRAAE